MATLAANTPTTVTLTAGQKLGIKDSSGVYTVGPAVGSSAPTTDELLDPLGTWIGPVSVATTVTIRPTTAGLTVVYDAEDGFKQPVTYDQTTGGLYAGPSLVSGGAIVAAPATLDASNVATYNGGNVSLAAAGTLTVSDAAWAGLTGGLTINVGQGGSATLAFSGTATKENASGSSASSVTLAASGVYVLLQSPTGTPKFRLSGGASL